MIPSTSSSTAIYSEISFLVGSAMEIVSSPIIEPANQKAHQPKGPIPSDEDSSHITHNWFPQDFLFGAATASYQVEGASAKGGRGISIWDEFCLRTPEKIAVGSNGVVACDMYHRYKEDIQMMKQMGFNSYRFSISWPRILPSGRCWGGINREGIDYYNDVINTVIANGMIPCATIFHWDLPALLEKEYGGFLSKRVKDDLREFAEVCFWEFGDRVKLWATLNEPATYAVNGYVTGKFAPGKIVGGSDTKPADVATPADAYIVARNLLLAHAEVVHLYRTKFQKSQRGKIGMVLNSYWCTAFDQNSEADKDAAYRALDFTFGWFLEPALYGRYPKSMIQYVPPENLPYFKEQEIEMLKNSIDFLGLNYYTGRYVKDDPDAKGEGYVYDQKTILTTKGPDGDIGKPRSPGSSWIVAYPQGIYYLLDYIQKKYPTLNEIYITENGYADKDEPGLTRVMACNDTDRRKFHQDHLANLWKVMKDNKKVKVKGYYVWAWCDNFEWSDGYVPRFGLIYIDYKNDLTRYPKESAIWFSTFLKSNEKPPLWAELSSGKRSIEEEEEEIVETDKRLKVVENNH